MTEQIVNYACCGVAFVPKEGDVKIIIETKILSIPITKQQAQFYTTW